MQELSSGPMSQVEESRLSCWPGPGAALAQPELTQKEWERFKAAHQPHGAIPQPLPPAHSWPSPSPPGLPWGQSWNPQKPNPRVTSKWLPGCSPLSSALTTVIQTPAAPGPAAGSTDYKGHSRSGSQSPGPSHVPASLPQHVPSPWPEPAHCGGLLPHALRLCLQDLPKLPLLLPTVRPSQPLPVACPLWAPVGPGHPPCKHTVLHVSLTIRSITGPHASQGPCTQ